MGLSMSVGALAFAKDEEADSYQWLLEEFEEVNRVLRANGLPEHVEPEKVPRFRSRSTYVGQPYAMLHYLRRAVAHAIRRRKLRPLPPDTDPTTDDLYDSVLFACESHVICHSDCEGFYVPVDFPAPLYDNLPDSDPHCVHGGILGSSQGAMRE